MSKIEQRLAAIERAATCGTGVANEPCVDNSPAQTGVGEASVVYTCGCSASGSLVSASCPQHGNPEASADSPDAERESEPTPGMVAAAIEICDRVESESRKYCGSVFHPGRNPVGDTILKHVGPELDSLKADNARLKDDYTVAVNNIGYRSEELNEARAEIERLKESERLATAVAAKAERERNDIHDALNLARQQLATATAEREAERQAIMAHLGINFDKHTSTYSVEGDNKPDSVFCTLIGAVGRMVQIDNTEKDQHRDAAEAMEAIGKFNYIQLSKRPRGDWQAQFGSGQPGYGPTPTAAILAAKAASGTNTGEK